MSLNVLFLTAEAEPCGLSQMMAMRYGCVPIARATGGLSDTILHIPHKVNKGTGFLFERPYPSVFAKTLKRAFLLFQKSDTWQQIQQNGMQVNFSWKISATKYLEMYNTILGNTI